MNVGAGGSVSIFSRIFWSVVPKSSIWTASAVCYIHLSTNVLWAKLFDHFFPAFCVILPNPFNLFLSFQMLRCALEAFVLLSVALHCSSQVTAFNDFFSIHIVWRFRRHLRAGFRHVGGRDRKLGNCRSCWAAIFLPNSLKPLHVFVRVHK